MTISAVKSNSLFEMSEYYIDAQYYSTCLCQCDILFRHLTFVHLCFNAKSKLFIFYFSHWLWILLNSWNCFLYTLNCSFLNKSCFIKQTCFDIYRLPYLSCIKSCPPLRWNHTNANYIYIYFSSSYHNFLENLLRNN